MYNNGPDFGGDNFGIQPESCNLLKTREQGIVNSLWQQSQDGILA
jgi:hypothetical protein